MAARAPSAPLITFDEFIDQYDEIHAEWVNGEVVVLGGGEELQSRIIVFLASLLQYWADLDRVGDAYVPPYFVQLDEETIRQPDLFFMTRETAGRYADGKLALGAPDLVVEVIINDSRSRDLGQRYRGYERAGVAEYWVIDPARELVDAFRLSDGAFVPVDLGDPPVLRTQALPGLEIPAEWIWRRPRLPDVFARWGAEKE
ncbi:MAG TPA: Uma2 family endonuclease [Longimicrobium sp.]|nr:Uma2 family endonuclease [Longimicrobium sp.]